MSGELAKKRFRRENWNYAAQSDTYINGRTLVFKEEVKRMSDNKYERTVRVYECQSYANCAFAADCKQKAGQYPCNRRAQQQQKKGASSEHPSAMGNE